MTFLKQICRFCFLLPWVGHAPVGCRSDGAIHRITRSDSTTPVQAAQQTPGTLQQLVAPIALYPDAFGGANPRSATIPTNCGSRPVAAATRQMKEKTGQEVDKQPGSQREALVEFLGAANMDKNLS